MKTAARVAVVLTLGASFWYTVLSVVRWEWNRALFFGLVFVAAEVLTATMWIGARLSRMQEDETPPDPRVLQALERSRPAVRRFDWLAPLDRTNVFITLLVGGGIVVSALAWLLDRIASRTMTATGERRLAQELRAIGYPDDGLFVDDMSVLAHDLPYLDDPQLRRLLRRPGHVR